MLKALGSLAETEASLLFEGPFYASSIGSPWTMFLKRSPAVALKKLMLLIQTMAGCDSTKTSATSVVRCSVDAASIAAKCIFLI